MIPGKGNPAMQLYEITLVWCVLKSVPCVGTFRASPQLCGFCGL